MEYSFFEGKTISKNRYRQIKLIGEGAYGKVFKGIDSTKNDTPVAIKVIKTDVGDEGFPASALREIAMLRELKHPNICLLKDVIWDVENGKTV
jgi:serine/threonine protein kinase